MKMGANLLKVAAAVAVVATVSSVMAQPGGGGRRGGGGGFQVNPITVVKVEGVQKDLELSGDQKASIEKLEVTPPDFQAMQGMSPEERQKANTDTRAAALKKVDEILQPPQVARFDEIMLQLDGTAALRQPKVADKLKLTEDQKTKLTALFTPQQGGGGGAGGGGAQAREERDAKAIEILTADQKSQFTAMQGKKIEIDQAALRGGGGFGRGQGAPGGGKGGRGGKGGKGGKGGPPDA